MSNKVIALVGMPGSGKGTCTDHMAEAYGWPVVHFGNMVYEEVQRRGLDNVKDEAFVREDMRAQEGKDVLAKHVGRKTDGYIADGAEVVVLDGLYSWTEYKYLEAKYGSNLITIATVAPRALRYERILNRKDGHRKYTSVSQAIERDIAEIENLEKGGPIAFADYTIVNDSDTAAKLLADLDAILATCGVVPSSPEN